MGLGNKDMGMNYIELRHLIKAEGSEVSLTKCQWRTPPDGF